MAEFVSITDVLVVGGGPAGLATAIAARQRGLTVAVVEAAQPPIDKACGEGIMPLGLESLAKLGVVLPEDARAAMRGIVFVEGQQRVEAEFASGAAVAIRRTDLHSALLNRAIDAGVAFYPSTPVRSIRHERVSTERGDFLGGFLVGADGLHSKVRSAAHLDSINTLRRRYGVRRHFHLQPWSRFVEVHWNSRCQVYVTPLPQQVGVAVLTSDPHLRFEQALALFPSLQQRLADTEFASSVRGSLTLTCRLRRVCSDRVALVGDASGSADAITGDGLSMSFRHALALADAIASGSLREYSTAHRRINRLPVVMGELMLAMADHERFRRRVLEVFTRRPDTFQRLLDLHTGAISPGRYLLGDSLSLGWRILTA